MNVLKNVSRLLSEEIAVGLSKWEELPGYMRTEAVKPYYDILSRKKVSLSAKRGFDVVLATVLLILLIPVLFIIAILIKKEDPKAKIFFCQERVTQYGRRFKIIKFRTMISDAEKKGTQVTVEHDSRVTKIGRTLRKYRLDELPQLFNIIVGDMSFVGTRPEVVKYVTKYSPEMMATLLLPAGVTSEASIEYKDEDKLLQNAADADFVYVEKILPEKMKYNLHSLMKFSIGSEIYTMFKTIVAVFKRDKG